MNQILAKRYAFCDFSSILVTLIQYLVEMNGNTTFPDFEEKNGKCQLNICWIFMSLFIGSKIIHEDVKIKLFKYSLEGIALDWCRSLPASSIHSLASFHYAFHLFCKDEFPAESLFEDCCDEFEKQVQQEVVFCFLMF
jgi:hypothetical protein